MCGKLALWGPLWAPFGEGIAVGVPHFPLFGVEVGKVFHDGLFDGLLGYVRPVPQKHSMCCGVAVRAEGHQVVGVVSPPVPAAAGLPPRAYTHYLVVSARSAYQMLRTRCPVRGRWPEGPEGVGWANRSAVPALRLSRPPAILKVNCPEGAREGGLGHWFLSHRWERNSPPALRPQAQQGELVRRTKRRPPGGFGAQPPQSGGS